MVQLIVVVDPEFVEREELDPSNPFGAKLEKAIVMIQHSNYIYIYSVFRKTNASGRVSR